jgi:tetratricopeptide (TPR) repeat protein
MAKAYFHKIQDAILTEVDTAKRTLDIAVAWFSSQPLFDSVCAKIAQGVSVRLAIRDDYKNNHEGALDWQYFINTGGILYVDRREELHHKYCIIDGQVLITGSYNWTNNAAYRSIENVLISNEPAIATEYLDNFNQLISQLEIVQHNRRIKLAEVSESLWPIYETEIELDKPAISTEAHEEILVTAHQLYFRKMYYEAEEKLDAIQLDSFLRGYANAQLSAIYHRQNRYLESVSAGEKGIVNDAEDDADTHNSIGLAYCGLKRYVEAVREFDKSIALDPAATTWYANKIDALLAIGLDKEADKTALKFKELAANVIRANKGLYNQAVLKARIELAMLSEQSGSRADAIKYAKKAKEIYYALNENEQDLHDLDNIDKLLGEIII